VSATVPPAAPAPRTASGTHAARILVIDDEPQIRRFVRISLASEGHRVEEAGTGSEGLGAFLATGADLVILDLGLPDQDGHQVLRRFRELSSVPVIVLSVRSHQSEKVRALDAGANDYVTKPFDVDELLARVRGLLRRGGGAEPAQPVFDDGALRVDLARRQVLQGGKPLALTRKEYGVLALLVRNAGKVVTQQAVLREVWGEQHVADTHYLRIVVGKLRHKLGESASAPRHVVTEPGVGYRFVG
jgi:two-component system KDP operon response regulator KdpE